VAHAAGNCVTSESTTTCTFEYTGDNDQFIVPAGVTSVSIEAAGAQGGGQQNAPVVLTGQNRDGGRGGQVGGQLSVTPGETLDIQVGGQGQAPGDDARTAAYPDGGIAGSRTVGNLLFPGENGGGGGGSSRVIRSETTLVVAGGGGGTGARANTTGGAGGHIPTAGELSGIGGGGASALAGGTKGVATTDPTGCSAFIAGADGSAGSAGTGGAGGDGAQGGGGGGGGRFGGGGGAAGAQCDAFNRSVGGAGGGGISYADPVVSGVIYADDVRSGNGRVTISYVEPAAPPSGSLSASVDIRADGTQPTVNLTAEGTTEWAIWGTSGSTSLTPLQNAIPSGSYKLSNVQESGGPFVVGSHSGFVGANPWSFSWTNGTGPVSGTGVLGGISCNHSASTCLSHEGFSFDVSATTTPQRLKVYTGAHGGTGTLTAHLSDSSAPDVTQSHGVDGFNTPGVYTIDFAAGSPGQTLHVTWALSSHAASGNGSAANVQLHAITLAPIAPADPPQADDGSYVVNTSADHNDGVCGSTDCTLREAILASNGFVSANANSITFAIPGSGTKTIEPLSPLPALSNPATIDGTTQAGASCAPTRTLTVALDGNSANGAGLSIAASGSGSTIKGLSIDNFTGAGIQIAGDDNVVQCSAIGTTQGNLSGGVVIDGGAGNLIGSDNDGTSDAAEANEIARNGGGESAEAGIVVVHAATNNRFDGNSIHDNGGLGIDLADNGVTANDLGDADIGPNGLQNFPDLVRVEGGANGGIAGKFALPTGQSADVSLFVSDACDGSGFGEGATRIGTATVTGDASGLANFAISIAGLPVGKSVTATATSASGATSEFSKCAPIGSGNDSWPNATDISSLATGSDALTYSGQTRWYKFSITPGSTVTVKLGNLPADYDLLLFSDIQHAYDVLNSGDPTLIAAQFSGTGQKFSGTGQKFSGTGQKFSEDIFSGTGQKFSGTGQKFSGDLGFSGDAFSGTGQKFSAQDFSGTGQKFSDTGASGTGQKFSPEAYSGAQAVSLIDFSANTGVAPEAISANTWNNTGSFYVRVSGRGGVFAPTSLFTVSKSATGNDCAGLETFSTDALPTPTTSGIQTVILTDSSRLPGWSTSSLSTQLAAFKARGEVKGAVVDVAGNQRFIKLNAQAVAHTACPYAKNLIADAYKQVVDSFRTSGNNLKYVVIVGGDDVVPFFRYPDTSTLGPESSYLPPVGPLTASESSLRLNYVLSQDAYGARIQLPQASGPFPIGDLAVGRLVETASEASTVLGAYLATSNGTVATPTRSLVTGYDFMTDGAHAVQAELSAGMGTGAGLVKDTLIAPNNILPTDPQSWTAAQLRTKLLQSGRHDLIFLAGHFSANRALAADFDTTMLASEISTSTTDFTNSIVFSQGCHSGYGIVDADGIPNVTDTLDWAQAFARKGATLIAGTGYQYGDTDLVQYSEAIYADFAKQLHAGTGSVSVGNALLAAKKTYLANTPNLDGVDVKALLESSVFGLPMLSVNMPAARGTSGGGGGVTPTAVPGSTLGLSTADLGVPTGTGVTNVVNKPLKNPDGTTGPTATYYVGPNGSVVTSPNEPALPLVSANVTAAGTTLRGVGFRGGTYADTTGITPLVTDPATEVRTPHTTFISPIYWPIEVASANYFDALGGGQTRLLVTPVQHKSDAAPATTDTLRRFTNVNVRLFYSNDTSAAARSAPPSIVDTTATSDGTKVTFSIHVAGDPAAQMQGVWVTYTGWDITQWQSLDLTKDPADPSHWVGSLLIPGGKSASQLQFIGQAVNGTGLVTLDSNFGAFYGVTSGSVGTPAATTLALGNAPTSGAFGTNATFTATLSGATPLVNQPIDFSLGGVTKTAFANASGQASATFTLNGTEGSYPLTASFAGTAGFAPSAASRPFMINKVGTTLTLSGPASSTVGQPTGVVANLKDGNGNVLGSQTVFFVVSNASNAQSTAVITDYLGNASLGSLSLPIGNYTVAAYFQGTFTLLPSNTTISLLDSAYGASTANKPFGIYWPFNGFFQPVDNTIINTANAGQAIPVKFSLSGNRGTTTASLFLTGYPKVVTETCTNSATDPIETFSSATSNSLTYDASSDQYTYVWKTDKSLAGKCVRLELGLIDGSTRVAHFKFK
jgi:CSLREA domain-containing protein